MTKAVDLDAYFSRIGYAGARQPTLSTLRAIHALHPAAIAFENLDPLLRRRIHLDVPSIEKKLIRAGRGGYCFEQNGLLSQVLTALGFHVTGLAARVLIGHAPGSTRRSHMLLKIDLDGERFIADVGLGSWAMSAPLNLDTEGEQETPHGPFRIIRHEDYFDVQTIMNREWVTLYRFSQEEQMPMDYEVSNWFCSTHPESKFTTDLMAARLPPGRRLGLSNRRFSIHYPGGHTERRELADASEIAAVLENDFGIKLPEPREELLAVLARLPG
ncbi:MAG TPA: arylamine N-acetyltransferase [Micropepsaceae bacterium]|nr:arylamine N-acetyltransferase [Micropepsaceae bacterium]